jgi:hypothetical protein
MNAPAKLFSSGAVSPVFRSRLVALYRPKETYSERVTTFLTKAQSERFERLLRVWTALDQAHTPDAKGWSDAEGARRFIDSGLDGAWAELGGEPQSEEQLVKLIDRVTADVAKLHKKR